MAQPFDLSQFEAAAFTPEMTLEMYKAFPVEASKRIEVVDGWLVQCEIAEPSHQAIQVNFASHLWAAVKSYDTKMPTTYRVSHDLDVLFSDNPKLHFRSPDVVVYRRVDADRGLWAVRAEGRTPSGRSRCP